MLDEITLKRKVRKLLVHLSILAHLASVRRKLGQDNVVGLGIVCIIGFGMANFILSSLLGIIYAGLQPIVKILLYIIVAYALLLNVPYILKSITRIQAYVFGAFVCVFIVSMLLSRDKNQYYSDMRVLLFMCLPLYFLFGSVSDYKRTIKYLEYCAYIILIGSALSATVFRTGWDQDYSMGISYQSYIASVILMTALMSTWRWTTFFMLLLSFVTTVISGTRGPLLFDIIMIIVLLIYKITSLTNKRKATVVFAIFVGIAIMAILLSENMISILENIPSLREYSRAIRMLQSGKFFAGDGRVERYQASLDLATKNIWYGAGIIRDRYVIGNHMGIGPTYAHNFVLEILVQFGLVPGILLLLVLVRLVFSRLRENTSHHYRLLMLLLILSGLLPLMLSHSYTRWGMFFAFMGFVLNSGSSLLLTHSRFIQWLVGLFSPHSDQGKNW